MQVIRTVGDSVIGSVVMGAEAQKEKERELDNTAARRILALADALLSGLEPAAEDVLEVRAPLGLVCRLRTGGV